MKKTQKQHILLSTKKKYPKTLTAKGKEGESADHSGDLKTSSANADMLRVDARRPTPLHVSGPCLRLRVVAILAAVVRVLGLHDILIAGGP